MSPEMIVMLGQRTLQTAVILAAPLLIALALVSLLINIVQVLTSLQDNTISSVPRLLATAVGAAQAGGLHLADVRRFPAAAALEAKGWNCDSKIWLPPWLLWERASPGCWCSRRSLAAALLRRVSRLGWWCC